MWRPGDNIPTLTYQVLDWQQPAKIEVLGGQHRKAALQKMIHEDPTATENAELWWTVNVYDLTAMPFAIRIDLCANATNDQKEGLTFVST